MNKIRVSFFLPSLECGGAERNTINLLRSLNKEKYELSLVLVEKKGDFLKDVPQDVKIFDFNSSNLLKTFVCLLKYFKENESDIFVSAFPRFNAVSLLAKKFAGGQTKIILTEHLTLFLLSKNAKTASSRFIARFIFPYFIKFFYPDADAIICVSEGIFKELCTLINNSDKIKVIYNPIAGDKIQNLAEEKVDHFWFSNLKVPLILMVGRLARTKDQPNLFRAVSLIARKQPVHLAIVGSGPEENKLRKLAEELGLAENIVFLGFQENPFKYMKRSSVFVLSSLQEGFGNVIVEAMACGTPVVATDCPSGPGEIILNGVNGLLVPVQNPEALAEAILKVINNSELAEKLSVEGKIRAEYFSVEKSISEYEKVFEKILKNK